MPENVAGRKVLFFLGAGASRAAGASITIEGGGHIAAPTQQDFWEVLLRFCSSRKDRLKIESFLFRYFLGYQRVPGPLSAAQRRAAVADIDVEEVFTFLSERYRAPSTSSSFQTYALKVWVALVTQVGHVFKRFKPNPETRRVFRKLMSNHIRSKDAVVSFNWDTVFEESLFSTQSWHYECVEDAPRSLRVLKPHGSVNWDYDEKVTVTDAPGTPVIVAPTHLKFVSTRPSAETQGLLGYLDQAQEIRDVWQHMEKHMREAKALVFIGYSFPVADLYFSSVLRSVLAARDKPPGLILVNPDAVALGARLRSRFAVGDVASYFDLGTFLDTSRSKVLAQVGL